jgi:hypothetical protein
MKLKKIITLAQNIHGLDMGAILNCDKCSATRFYRQVMPDEEAHEKAIEQVPCLRCIRMAGACESCED